jgi:hypothetical protein
MAVTNGKAAGASSGKTAAPSPPPPPKRKRPSLNRHASISPHDLRRVAVAAECDPRCVVKYLSKLSQHSTMRARIERALHSCALGHLVDTANGLTK